MRLNAIKINKIVKRHEKTRLKSSFVAGPFSTRKHEENVMFQCSSNQICRNARENTCKITKTTILLWAIKAKMQIPRENTCKLVTDAPPFAKLCKILETSLENQTHHPGSHRAASQPSHSQPASQPAARKDEKTRAIQLTGPEILEKMNTFTHPLNTCIQSVSKWCS